MFTLQASDGTKTVVPALYFVAGDTSGDGALANDVFVRYILESDN